MHQVSLAGLSAAMCSRLFAAVVSLLAPVAAAAATPAHFLIMLSDDTGWWNMGWNNDCANSCGDTPFMNGMVKSGLRLDQHYAFRFCSPTRSALLSGRLPIHVNQQNSASWGWTAAAVHPKFTLLPEKLASAGYLSHQIGKWHLGLSRQAYTPAGRGFNSSLGFLMGSEDHYAHTNGLAYNGTHVSGVDFWETDRPAKGYDGIYSAYIYAGRAVELIESHPPDKGLFLYVAFADTHEPEQAPDAYVDHYAATDPDGSAAPPCRRLYNGMASAVD